MDKPKFIEKDEKKGNIKSTIFYIVRKKTPGEEVDKLLRSLINNFGIVGIRHLNQVFKEKMTEEELNEITKKFEVSK